MSANRTDVYLITGFLGSGKTTFLNRIIDRFPEDKKLTLLINEFGEIGVDGTLVEGEDIDMMEISKGSIFCVCVKTDFIKGLYELNSKVKPDVLLIESTGVANPKDLKNDLQLPIFNDRFQFKEQFCIIDAAHFLDAYDAFASIEKQIESSTVFIINKTDIAGPETIEKIREVVRQFHPDPEFYETNYARVPLDKFFPEVVVDEGKTAAIDMEKVLTNGELNEYIDELLESPNLEITPPDLLVSSTYAWQGNDLKQIEKMAKQMPKQVVRSKGFVEKDDKIYVFNYVMGDWSIEESDIPRQKIKNPNIIVFIAPPQTMEEIEKTLSDGDWINRGIFSPMETS